MMFEYNNQLQVTFLHTMCAFFTYQMERVKQPYIGSQIFDAITMRSVTMYFHIVLEDLVSLRTGNWEDSLKL